MNRRNFLKYTAQAGVGTLLAPWVGSIQAKRRRRPNVLILIADDMNDYGFYNTYPGVKMPYLEKFKQTALTFDRAYCGSPACVPSRAAVFSGLYPHTTGSYLNGSNPWKQAPFTAPKRFFEMYRSENIRIPMPGWRQNDMDDIPPLGRKLAKVWGDRFDIAGINDQQQWRKFVLAYCACTTFADWSVGHVIEALDQSPYAENTIVMFWSDNGYHCGEKDHWEKTTLWEQAALTPMAIRVPGHGNEGKHCQRTVTTVDLFPTLADYCSLELPQHKLEGRNLRLLIEHPAAKWNRPALTTYGERCASIRDERYRYIRYPDGTEELYDHQNDPHELSNLASNPAYDAIKKGLTKWIPDTWAKSLGGRPG